MSAAWSVHPRASGERWGRGERSRGCSGSSPRERGTQCSQNRAFDEPRFIPARAGNANYNFAATVGVAVHPRASGERSPWSGEVGHGDGSSPRERGTLFERLRAELEDRFIPARAGNASERSSRPQSASVHPRASGERMSRFARLPRAAGSSPRERGTRGQGRALDRLQRFIPARAGNARARTSSRSATAVHPRASGEREAEPIAIYEMFGSSPRERGTPHGDSLWSGVYRFIPARAGNALSPAPRCRPPPVHPRASGERLRLRAHVLQRAGSSPRERGTPVRRDHVGPAGRFIPARAGNADRGWRSGLHVAVHPRASGERGGMMRVAAIAAGSSPRERGTLFLEELDLVGILRCQTAHRQFSHFLAVCQRLRLLRERAERTAPA